MDIVLKIMIVGLSIFEVYLCYQFLFLCWADKKELSRGSKIVLAVVCIVIGGVAGINRSLVLFSHWMLVTELIIVSLSLLAIPMEKKLIAMELVGTYLVLTALMDFLFAFVFLNLLGGNNAERIFGGDSVYKIVIFLCTRILMLLFFGKVRERKELLKQTICKYHKELFVLFVSIVIILRVYQTIFAEYLDMGVSLQITGAVSSLVAIFILFILGVSVLLKNAEVKKELDFILLKEDMVNSYYQQVAMLLEESREHIHDMKHHLQILDNYAKSGETKRIRVYLQEIGLPVLSLGKMAWTDSQILNVVLNQKKADAKRKDIDMNIMIEAECHLPLTDYEVASLFSNLLDNALEACAKIETGVRWIEIQINKHEEMTFIHIKNNINQLPPNLRGKFRSAKVERGLHGLGLCSVERTVNKYNGALEIKAEGGSFSVHITFFEQDTKH